MHENLHNTAEEGVQKILEETVEDFDEFEVTQVKSGRDRLYVCLDNYEERRKIEVTINDNP